MANFHFPLSLLHGAVIQDLLPTELLLLEGPKAFLFLLGHLFHVGFTNLLGALVEDGVLLLLIKTLEVVRLDAVGSEHALLSLGVLSHEVVIQGEILFRLASVLSCVEICSIAVTLLTRQLEVGVLVRDEHVFASLFVLLGVLDKEVIVVGVQVVSVLFIICSSVLVILLLFHLLFNPVFLL